MLKKTNIYFYSLLLLCNLYSCSNINSNGIEYTNNYTITYYPLIKQDNKQTKFDSLLRKNGFIPINEIDSTILFDLRYSTTNNFVGIDLYKDFETCYVPTDIALRLHAVQQSLQLIDTNYSLVIFDAARPLSIQKLMWDSCNYKGRQKKNFLANPNQKSLHNYGAAVDVTLAYKGDLIDMGTDFDYAGEAAYTYIEEDLVAYKKITKEQYTNRLLLRNKMKEQKFIENKYEWWHFGACYKSEVEKKYPLIISFDSIQPLPTQ